MTTRWARVARGLVAASISLFTAAAFHIIAGGAIPTPVAIVSCFVVSSFVCVAFSGKKLSLPRLSVAVGLSQFLFHGVFSLWTTQPALALGAGHAHDHMVMFLPNTTPAGADADMWLAHLIAAAATIAALRRGEAAFWGLLATARLWLGSILAKLAAVVPARTPRPAMPVQRIASPPELVLLFSSRHHRGPPSMHSTLAAG
jgi:hypothetical protein